MKILGRKNRSRKRWKEKALLVDTRRVKLVLVATGPHKRSPHTPPWIYERFERHAQFSNLSRTRKSLKTSQAELALADRFRQENKHGELS